MVVTSAPSDEEAARCCCMWPWIPAVSDSVLHSWGIRAAARATQGVAFLYNNISDALRHYSISFHAWF